MEDPIHVEVKSITTDHVQKLYLSKADCENLKGKRILIVDDVISTGESLAAMEELLHAIGGKVVGKACVLAEGDAKDRTDIIYLEPLPCSSSKRWSGPLPCWDFPPMGLGPLRGFGTGRCPAPGFPMPGLAWRHCPGTGRAGLFLGAPGNMD